MRTAPKISLTEANRQLYKLEQLHNFRWVTRWHLAPKSTYTLTSANFAPADLQLELSEIGQFADVAYRSAVADIIWKHLASLTRPDYPLETYDALQGSSLISAFFGSVAEVKGYVVFRPVKNQAIVAISGTSSAVQALYDVDAHRVKYPYAVRPGSSKVHSGFWRLYRGIKTVALSALEKCLKERNAQEIVVTGHSMGAALSYLLVMDLLSVHRETPRESRSQHLGLTIKIVAFGSPRVGNRMLVQHYRDLVAKYRAEFGVDKFHDYSVKGYNDGVPSLPPRNFGFQHFNPSPLYLHHSCLYQIPPSECEFSIFDVLHDEEGYGSRPPDHPRGGHNYYNGRDLEKFVRRIDWLEAIPASEQLKEGWEKAYLKKLTKERRKMSVQGSFLSKLWKRK